MYDGMLLETVEGLGDPKIVSNSLEIWQRLQDEKTDVSQSLLNNGALTNYSANDNSQADASDEVITELEWQHRSQLEARLRAVGEAQDRLMEGVYGRCTDCGEAIDCRRLAADPATALCLTCQSTADRRQRFFSL